MSMSSSPYAPAAQLLTQIWTQHKSLKTLVYDKKGTLRCNKTTYAQVCHVLANKRLLEGVIQQVPLLHVRNPSLLFVLLYELLLGPNRKIRGGGALKRQIMEKESELKNALEQLQQQEETHGAKTSVSFPRYVRINTLQADCQEVLNELQSQHELYADAHVPNLLVLPPNTSLFPHALVESGRIILQDKSSCFSALCLIHGNAAVPLEEGDYLDACAAPGNKTSHLAALVGESCSWTTTNRTTTIHALDRSLTRVASLQRRMTLLTKTTTTTNVQVVVHHLDFLKTNPSDYLTVRGILLDPSCSGSGMFTSLERQMDKEETTNTTTKRMESLSNFQLMALQHAMSFPQVTRIVYSTCSLYEQENEIVVSQALSQCNGEWHLVAPACLQHWKRRGHAVGGLTNAQAKCLVRADRDDETNGFFVAYLERTNGKSQHNNTNDNKMTSGAVMQTTKIVPPEGIAVYNGEFSRSKRKNESQPMTESESSSTKKNNHHLNNNKKKQESQSSESVSDSKSSREEVTASAYTTNTKKKDKKMCKKRAKKVAWKRRQMEQKLQRLETKKTCKQD